MRRVNSQQGAVLMVSLIILLVLTLIGISGARGVLMGERMTSASRDAKIALEIAESMSRLGEKEIAGLKKINDFGGKNWQHDEGDGPVNIFAAETWGNTNSVAMDVPMLDPDGNPLQGRMYIERFGLASSDSIGDVDQSEKPGGDIETTVHVFKVVSRGVGIGGTERIVVTLYGKAF
ncbi:pilus assembly PilX family protein [Microbulbifer epialgicus]|uniref:PilX N-terminal domain-containing pilus assembly protein n=1 Tax=Microbulbifer epialgicus TaxID=393907 RepID=A0ABV4NXU5_9GAMM